MRRLDGLFRVWEPFGVRERCSIRLVSGQYNVKALPPHFPLRSGHCPSLVPAFLPLPLPFPPSHRPSLVPAFLPLPCPSHMVSTTRVMMMGLPTRLQAWIRVFCTRAIFSGSTSRPRLPRLRMMPSASLRMPCRAVRGGAVRGRVQGGRHLSRPRFPRLKMMPTASLKMPYGGEIFQ